MAAIIKANTAAIARLKDTLETAGENYKENLGKLTNLVSDIKDAGHIQGEPADEFVKKFEEKRERFNLIAQTIDEAQEYMGVKKTKFRDTLDEIISRYL